MSTESTRSGEALRLAVSRYDFAAVPAAAEQYIRSVSGARSPSDLAEARDLLAWAGRVLSCARAHLQEDLHRVGMHSRYLPCSNSPAPNRILDA